MDDSMEKAIRFISEELKENPSADRLKLIERAGREFNLSPIQTEFLTEKFVLNKV
ncbi:MAG TPA: hypothetical protein PKX79_04870 [Spirochaetota bacterium]|jgi:DNA helicase HerA-like ATPase|nr:hypothetical protein [Spirochaetota bacterium]OQA97668.1 MAG: hypothetical protein BWY23_01425 [Spirochaetes bacterium ADurb.Bin218]HOK02133.1 hypothetical protein [Spirochaetota bacterium]HOK93258.1 hypothetical protein [Spirochaetota bacterium]HON16288.1 hypothetical protein [Spirochaetota bacterium]